MSVQFIEGGAGTGKSTMLVERLGQCLATKPLDADQRVLALTKMHGSRRRLHERLRGVVGLNRRFESITIDSFAWRVIARWRSLARALVPEGLPSEFDARCDLAGRLLEEPFVQTWVAASFPIVIVDELQDSKGGQLRVLQGLAARCECIAAGDPFQDLEGEHDCAGVEWARQQCAPTVLTTIHRTSNAGLVAAATAFREAQPVVESEGFLLKGVPSAPFGAWVLASHLFKWKPLGTVAVIVPVTASKSPFVHRVIERVNSDQPFRSQWWPAGSFNLTWEAAQDEEVAATCEALGLPEDDEGSLRVEHLALNGPRAAGVREWMSRQRRLFGRREFPAVEIRSLVKELTHQRRIYSRITERRLTAMTIHQAKNREFDRVVLLWPYQVTGSDERKRRLAYNAITRARYEALVIVENAARLAQPPFSSSGEVPTRGGEVRKKRRSRRTKGP